MKKGLGEATMEEHIAKSVEYRKVYRKARGTCKMILKAITELDNYAEKKEILTALIKKAKSGDVKAIELYIRLMGEMPAEEKVVEAKVSGVEPIVGMQIIAPTKDD